MARHTFVNKTKKWLGCLILALQIIIISVIQFFPDFVERYYSNGIYIYLSKIMRYVFGWLPFSIGDVIYIIAIIYILRWFIINRKRIIKDTLNWVLDIVNALAFIYVAFHILWGYNYYRQPLYVSLNQKPEYTSEELIKFTERLIEISNAIHLKIVDNDSAKIVLPYTKKEIFNGVSDGYKTLAEVYPNLNYNPQSIKPSLYSTLLTYMGFSGYINPLTNEAQIDDLIPLYKYPTTACHEVAHQIGYAAENEANFIGALAAINNNDIYFNYCGYTFALRYCLAALSKQNPEQYEILLPKINRGIIKNYIEVERFWAAYKSDLEPVFKILYDGFLKTNNQDEGVKTYSYVVSLLVNYYSDRPL